MDPQVQAFKDKLAEKAEAKQATLVEVGNARLAEAQGRTEDAERSWSAVAALGINGGYEGKFFEELQSMADAYVAAHPEHFVAVQQYVTPDGLENIVRLIDLMREAGMEEEALKLTMFELASFERQEIGATPRATVRMGNGG